MENIDEIRDRINKKEQRSYFSNFVKTILLLFVLLLGFLIYARNDESAVLINKIFSTNISFVKMNDEIDLFLSKMLANFNIFTKNNEEDVKVNNSNLYIKDEDNYFKTNTNEVYSLFYGKVVAIQENNEKFNITVFYENEVTACYYGLTSSIVIINDLIEQGDIIGTYENNFKVLFKKNNTFITYEEALFA